MSAQNSRRQYAWVVESTFGVTPASPSTQAIEVVSFDGDLNAAQLNSQTIRADRQVGFSRRGNLGVEGSLVAEMVPGNFDWALEAVTGGTWTSNVLKIGNTVRSFSIEEGFLDIGQYRTFTGVMLDSLAVDIKPDALVQATFGLMGKGSTAFSGTSIDASPTAITKKDVFYHDGGTISEGGSPVAFITGVKFDLKNNLQGNYALGDTSYRSISQGRVEVTGTVTALFESAALYNKFRNSTSSTLSVTLSAGSPAETLTFTFPDVRYTTGKVQRGETGPVLVELGFTAVYDDVSATSLSITRG